jgi:sigma-B regulation protein RsbU (phosphoserine phosphatase)
MSDLISAPGLVSTAVRPESPPGGPGAEVALEQLTAALQLLLLPPRLPSIPGLDVAWCYRPASRLDVGGDFFDLFPLGGGSWGLAIGDVCGKGPAAATVAAAVRHGLRAAAIDRRQPSEVLSVLNESMLLDEEEEEARFCTAAYGRLRAFRDGFRVTLACGGHPQPFIIRAGGSVEEAGASGTVLGLIPEADFFDHRLYLRPGDALVLFTDGLTEAGDPRVDLVGREGVAEVLASQSGKRAQEVVDALLAKVRRMGRIRDDLAILVLRAQQ